MRDVRGDAPVGDVYYPMCTRYSGRNSEGPLYLVQSQVFTYRGLDSNNTGANESVV